MPLIYLVAGETSGDVLGARLIAALRRFRPDLDFTGVGGRLMAEQGVDSLFPMRELALMGLLEVVPRLNRLRHRLRQTGEDIAHRRPAAVVTIDSPGFTLRLLKTIRTLGIPRAHYVAPQAWAWREGRVRHFPGLWESLLCLLPFEPAFFARHGLPARFVGHPVRESGANAGDGARFRAEYRIAPEARLLTLMPGSRRTEVSRLLPVLGRTLDALVARVPCLVPVMPVAAPVADAVREGTRAWPLCPIVVTDTTTKHDAFAASAAALTKSGTSTLELALAGVPMAVAYRVNPLSAAIARRLITVRYASLPNLLSGEEIVPEFLQGSCTPARLAAALGPLLTDPEAAEQQRRRFPALLDALRPPGGGLPSEAAARAVLDLLDQA